MTPTDTVDERHMAAALGLARRGLGQVWPNPAVGCVIVAPGGGVVGRGWTQPGGRPHAETEALARAGDKACGATAYVTLEPCDHHGQTPPCSQALVDAGVARVVAACVDPDPRVAGSGLKTLENAGISVTSGVLEGDALALNAGFFIRLKEGRPLFTLKMATSLDGRIATASGDSQWITGPRARSLGHALRASHDAIVTGIGTVLADDPALTCRLPGLAGRSPRRLVVDSEARLPLDSQIVCTAGDVRTLVFVDETCCDPDRCAALEGKGIEVVRAPSSEGGVDVGWLARELAADGLTRVLVECGGTLAANLLRAGLIDRLAWFQGGVVIGGDGIGAMADLGLDKLADAPRFVRDGLRAVDGDTLATYAITNSDDK